ncbi:MAG TPA: ATP-binding protein [Oligoflexus sp.]|uniref:ATP-binding protein n=1 Tax=Oligoflexus sp. TaxID=1971216 RepID=UPI002D7FC417|nr:ATP-binding protein [Oligoflexus sp.]HET9237841.1 ATP-binding protein [Oligoflexus sp.]
MEVRCLRSPFSRFAFMLFVNMILLMAAIMFARQETRPAVQIQAGDILQAGERTLAVEPLDLIGEPGEISRDADLRRFFARQDILHELLKDPKIALIRDGSSQPLPLAETTLASSPLLFWIQLLVGGGAFTISAWIWSLRPRDKAASLFLLSGGATLLFTFSAAIYTTRGLALPGAAFRALVALNEGGASIFGLSMLALFMIHPFRFHRGHLIFKGVLVFFGLWTLGIISDFLPAWAGVNLLTLVEMLGICSMLVAQYFATKGKPAERASLAWLGLSIMMGAGFFIAFNAVPLVLGWNAAVEQGYAFLAFLFIYLGLAAGISRFRLFEVGRWAYRFLFHVAGACLLLALDALLVFALDWERLPALGFSFFLLGLFYLPLRDFIGARLRPGSSLKAHQLMEALLPVAFAPSANVQRDNWQKLLRRIYDPLEIAIQDPPVSEVQVDALGLTLLLPAIGDMPSLKLGYPSSGRTLFSPDALQLARQIVNLMAQAEISRKAYDRGVFEERQRMAQDLHDDVGARLLTALHQCDDNARPTLQAVMADIKELVGEMNGDGMSLGEVLADLRYETSRRLSASGMALEWAPSFDDSIFDKVLSYREHKALRSAFREIISNSIRHAKASCVQIKLKTMTPFVELCIEDDGQGIPPSILEGKTRGYGLAILQKRIAELGGRVQLASSSQGTSVQLIIPCENSRIPPETGGDLLPANSKLKPTGYSERA